MRIPWGAGVPSSATKLKETCTGSDVYELIEQTLISDNFANLNNWTVADPQSKITVSNNSVIADGTGVFATPTGISRQLTRAKMCIQIKYLDNGTLANNFGVYINNANAFPTANAANGVLAWTLSSLTTQGFAGTGTHIPMLNVAAQTEYTLTICIDQGTIGGTWTKVKMKIVGGVFTDTVPNEITTYVRTTEIANPFYLFFHRIASSSSNKITWKEFKVLSGYATDSPHVLYTADAGTGKTINGLDFTNLALPSGVADTNLEFDYSFDDGTESWSSKYSLTALKALGAISGSKRYLRMRVYQNSNGETQTYGAIVNADDAVTSVGAGASAPEDFLASAVAWGVQSVKVGWGASAGAMTYRVKRDGVDVSGELRNVSSFIDSPVAAGTYEYVVVAENDVDDTSSNTITLTKGAGGLATIYGVLSAIYRAMFNMQKIEKVGSTYYLNTYDDDDTTLVASCALKTFDAADIGNLAGTVTPSIRLKSAISGVGAELTGTIWERVQSLFKKEFNTRKNEEVVVGSGIVSEVVYDDNGTTKISQQTLKTFNGDNLPSQLNTTTPSQRMRSSI